MSTYTVNLPTATQIDTLNGHLSTIASNLPAPSTIGSLSDLTTTVKSTVVAAINEVNAKDGLPTQSGNNGKFLTTNGTAASWVAIPSATAVTDTTSTMIALPTAAANTNYTYGELTSLSVGFSSSSTANDEIHIMFKSGTTATTLTVDGTNALFSSFTPNTSSCVELDARFYAPLSKWIVLFSQVAIS